VKTKPAFALIELLFVMAMIAMGTSRLCGNVRDKRLSRPD